MEGNSDNLIPTDVYYMYNSDNRLLYIGMSSKTMLRFQRHLKQKDWWSEVACIKVLHYGSRPEARIAERVAIQTEKPLYNKVHNEPVSP